MGREGERRDGVRGYSVGFHWGQLFLVLTIILNQHKIFWDVATGRICTKLFRDACKYYNHYPGLFLSNGFSGAMTSTRITMRFSIVYFQKFDKLKNLTNSDPTMFSANFLNFVCFGNSLFWYSGSG
jgi:hypothetical protein